MEVVMSITETEIYEELRAALAHPEQDSEGAYTVAELADMRQMSIATVRRGMKRLIASGKATCVHVRRVGMDGRLARVPGYRIRAA